MQTKHVSFLSPKLDRYIQLKTGQRKSLRQVILDMEGKAGTKIFQHVEKEKKNNKVNIVFIIETLLRQ